MCTDEARPERPGYCDTSSRLPVRYQNIRIKHCEFISPQIDDVEYEDDTPDDVSADSAWGYCDSKCHVSVRDLGATVLQEVRFGECTFSLTAFIVRSNYLH